MTFNLQEQLIEIDFFHWSCARNVFQFAKIVPNDIFGIKTRDQSLLRPGNRIQGLNHKVDVVVICPEG